MPPSRSPRLLAGAARLAAVAAAAIMLFFTFGIAPSLFAVYPRAQAGEITGVLFPAYYHALYGLGGVAALALAAGRRGIRRAGAALLLVALAVGCVAAMDLVLGPMMDGLRGPANRPAFARLHGIAMLLNLLGLLAIGVASALPRPHDS